MGSSGLLYAAIVAAWAAVLVPRWIRRNEEVERVREEDSSRSVRVLDRHQRQVRAHSGLSADRDRPARRPPTAHPHDPADSDPRSGGRRPAASAAARRRRVLVLLLIAVSGTAGSAAAGVTSAGLVGVPASLLVVFLFLARRAAVLEARRRRMDARRTAMRRAAMTAEQQAEPAKRVAVLDEPAPAARTDPHAWDPVPVPRPTYLTKPKAEPRVVRKIDLSSPGAWTSGRLNPDSAVTPPPAQPQPTARSDVRERRRAVGD